MIKVYTASKLYHAEMWRTLHIDGVEFTARWPRLHVGTVPDDARYAKIFWMHDEEDVRASDVVLVYAEPKDKLRGALVEAGMAIALGKDVIVVGEHDDFGTWQYHPLVHKAKDMKQVTLLLRCLAMKRNRLS